MTDAHDDDSADPTHKVGRGKPPLHTRFKPGQSGNPKGRPRGSGDHWHSLFKAANERVTVVENGRRKRLPKLEIVNRQLTNKAMSGDIRSMDLMLKHLGTAQKVTLVAAGRDVRPEASFGSAEDEHVLSIFIDRMKAEVGP